MISLMLFQFSLSVVSYAKKSLRGAIFAGELALDGTIRPIKGAINIAEAAFSHGIHILYIPLANAQQASHIKGLTIIGLVL